MWSNELELNFLEEYQQEPIIWEPNNGNHKDRNKVHDAWNRISATLDIPVIELKKKKDSLMATYRMHLRRMKALSQSGASIEEDYKPIWFAFDLMHSFLKETVNNQNKKRNTMDQSAYKENESVDETQRYNDREEEEGEFQEMGNEEKFSPKQRKKNPPEVITAERMANEAVAILKNARDKIHEEEDECDLYGKILAKRLRKLSDEERINFMHEVDGVYIRRLKSLKKTKASSILAMPHSNPSYLLDIWLEKLSSTNNQNLQKTSD